MLHSDTSLVPGHRRAARTAGLAWLLAAALAASPLTGCAAHAPPAHAPAAHAPPAPAAAAAPPGSAPPPEAPPGTPDGAPAAPPAAKMRVVPVRLTTEVTRVASLVHFVDSLADTSGGKSVPAYRALWSARIGAPTEADRQALEAFRAARRSATAAARCNEPAPGSVNAARGWPTRFLYAMVDSRDLDSFLADIAPCLTPEESSGLAAALAQFEPGFDVFWREASWLPAFDRDFQEYLASGGLPLYLGEVARWFGVDPSEAPPPVISFVLLPAQGGTHAQELGRRLLVEIRPRDAPTDQVSVVAHEESHYLFYQMAPDRRAALEARALAAGPSGARVWRLLQEAIPTALGQGLAVARLKPEEFRPAMSWYHIPEIDALAHVIYPMVREGVGSGRTIDGDFIESCVRAYDEDLAHRKAATPANP